MNRLFHVSEVRHPAGSIIEPGRWGRTVRERGQSHPFFQREIELEDWRVAHTSVLVSRLGCAFAFDDLDTATKYAGDGEHVLSVKPLDLGAAYVRLDMLWLTWMFEPGSSPEKRRYFYRDYWASRATTEVKASANAAWELLFPCALAVL